MDPIAPRGGLGLLISSTATDSDSTARCYVVSETVWYIPI